MSRIPYIEAHICIAFAVCVVYKKLERQLKKKSSTLSPEKAIDILKLIYALAIVTPFSKSRYTRLLIKNDSVFSSDKGHFLTEKVDDVLINQRMFLDHKVKTNYD